eukprot:gene2800-3411_t
MRLSESGNNSAVSASARSSLASSWFNLFHSASTSAPGSAYSSSKYEPRSSANSAFAPVGGGGGDQNYTGRLSAVNHRESCRSPTLTRHDQYSTENAIAQYMRSANGWKQEYPGSECRIDPLADEEDSSYIASRPSSAGDLSNYCKNVILPAGSNPNISKADESKTSAYSYLKTFLFSTTKDDHPSTENKGEGNFSGKHSLGDLEHKYRSVELYNTDSPEDADAEGKIMCSREGTDVGEEEEVKTVDLHMLTGSSSLSVTSVPREVSNGRCNPALLLKLSSGVDGEDECGSAGSPAALPESDAKVSYARTALLRAACKVLEDKKNAHQEEREQERVQSRKADEDRDCSRTPPDESKSVEAEAVRLGLGESLNMLGAASQWSSIARGDDRLRPGASPPPPWHTLSSLALERVSDINPLTVSLLPPPPARSLDK